MLVFINEQTKKERKKNKLKSKYRNEETFDKIVVYC